jgi:CRISPR-associated protein Cas5d
MKPNRQVIRVWGEFACFTRPELKVERFSYPVPTPSAARGILDAIYCKPVKFRWQVLRIEVLKPIRYIALRRNEVKEKAPTERTILQWARGAEPQPILVDVDEESKGRTQRQTMALKNVEYRIHAEIRPWQGFEQELPALEAQFRRRAERGQYFHHPYLGCREFPAFFQLCEPDEQQPEPHPLDMNLGWMLYDTFDLSRPGKPDDPPFITLFQAKLVNGVLEVPEFDSDAVRKPPRRAETTSQQGVLFDA